MRAILLALAVMLVTAETAFPLDVIWQREGAGEASRYGYRILPLGDQNDDGFADWAVLNRGGAPTGDPSERRLEFFRGGNPPSHVPYMVIRGEAGVWDIDLVLTDAAGDVNGDGYIDWLIERSYEAMPDSEEITLFFGGPEADTIPDWRLTVRWTDAFFTMGDYNGDGFDDLFWYHQRENFADVFWGGDSPDTIPDWTLHWVPGTEQQPLLQSYGSLNGDIYSDWVSAAFNSNTTYIFLGDVEPDTVPAYTWTNMPHDPLEIVNDLNGDGFDELVYYNRDVHFGGEQMSPVPSAVMDFPCAEGVPTTAASAVS